MMDGQERSLDIGVDYTDLHRADDLPVVTGGWNEKQPAIPEGVDGIIVKIVPHAGALATGQAAA